jgi:hypothetical protein
MTFSIIYILLLTLIQFLTHKIWFSKIVFGSIVNKSINFSNKKDDYTKYILTCLIRSVVIYLITSELYFLLSNSLFMLSIMIVGLSAINIFEEYLLQNKSIKLFIITAGYLFFTNLLTFFLAILIHSN